MNEHERMLLRKQAATLFELGYGYKAVSTILGINRHTVRDWARIWRANGTETLCSKNHTKYPKEVKVAAVKEHLNGVTSVEVMERYSIDSCHKLKRWMRRYHQDGEDGL